MPEQLISTQIKMAKSQWEFLGKLGKELGYHDGRGDHSRLVREMVAAAAIKWQESPYICKSAENLVFITRDGHIFYQQVHSIKLNKNRERLPCSLQIKPEKKQDYLSSCPPELDEAAWLKSRWLLSYFAASHQGTLLDSSVDHDGMDSKTADLLVEQAPESLLTRETVVCLKEFVCWRRERRGYDRVGIPIDIPTRNLQIIVIVDIDIYRRTPLGKYEIPNLALEFRNPESARFESEAPARDRWNPMDDSLVGRCIDGEFDPNAEEMNNHLQRLKTRIEFLAEATASNGPVVSPEQRSVLLQAIELPSSFLYYKLRWPSPYFGVEACVRWEKPVKVS